MLKKTITYKDIDGENVDEDWYFNLSKSALIEMQMTTEGGMQAYLQGIVDSQDGRQIIDTFKMFISKSVGIRSGSSFVHNDEIVNQFMNSPAYDELFMELISNPGAGVEFVKGILPGDLGRMVEDVQLPENKEYTHTELLNMDDAQFNAVVGDDPRKMSKDHLMVAFQRKNRQAA
jgi:hypothetical protein